MAIFPLPMELYRILPLLIHIIVLLKFCMDIVTLRGGAMTRAGMNDVRDMYYIFLYVLMLTTFGSIFLRDRRLRIISILTGIIAFGTIWLNDKTFTPEYNKYPLYVPAGAAGEEQEDDQETPQEEN